MDTSTIPYISLVTFILITILYFTVSIFGRPALTLDILNEDGLIGYNKKILISLGIYLLVIVVIQVLLNSVYITVKCGGNTGQNILPAFIITLIPWILIFGVMIAVLFIFPGFKSAFSDVIGYYAVSWKANQIFADLLIDTNINEKINEENDPDKKKELSAAADAIIKIFGNKSILINQMNINNFIGTWNILNPLKKPIYQSVNGTDPSSVIQLKEALLSLIVIKENIGEALWYVYTAILISSIVYYNLATRNCNQSVSQIQESANAYTQQQETTKAQEDLNNSTVYTA